MSLKIDSTDQNEVIFSSQAIPTGNFVVSEFVDCYDLKEGDGMYMAPEDRIAVW